MNLTTLLLGLLPILLYCSSEVANYPVQYSLRTGEHKLFLATAEGPTVQTFPQSYRNESYTSAPYVGIGLLTFEAEVTSPSQLAYSIEIISITATDFTSEVTVQNGTTFNQLRYMYLSIDKSQNWGEIYFIQYANLTDFTGVINTEMQYIQSTNSTYIMQNNNFFLPFLCSFTMQAANSEFSVKIDTSIHSSSEFITTIESNSTITYLSYFVVWVDDSQLSRTHERYFDAGYRLGVDTETVEGVLDIPISAFNYYNYIQGANWFNLDEGQVLSFNLNGASITTLGTYNYVRANQAHWMERACSQLPYYVHEQSKCFDSCPSGFAQNDTYLFCQPCHYSCQECLSDGTTCTTCDNTTNRELNGNGSLGNGSCDCLDGFFDDGASADCGLCYYSCDTCSDTNVCVTCDVSRELVNESCDCLLGRFDTNANQSFCEECHYTCTSCQNTSTTCTECNTSAFRQLTSDSRCLCSEGYEDNGTQQCIFVDIDCAEECQTCEGVGTNCTSCVEGNNRQLSTNNCNCIQGYESVNGAVVCSQICGDGRVYEDACDDNNTDDGDGCSSRCVVEDGYSCDNATQPSLCIFVVGYTTSTQSILKTETANEVTAVFSFNRAPPNTSQPSLSGAFIDSSPNHTLDSTTLTLHLSYSSNIDENDNEVVLSMSIINTTHKFSLSSDNKLALNAYSSANYDVYSTEVLMVWILIGLVWVGTLVFIFIDKYHTYPLMDMILSMSLVWGGVSVFQRIMLFYYPLFNLRYLLGYNQQIQGEEGLLAYVNYGFILIGFPYVIVLFALLVNKCMRGTLLNQQAKNYLLFDLPFSALVISSMMVAYGLYTQSFTSEYTGLSIGSLVVGIVYLLFLLFCSIIFAIKQDFYYCLKIQILKPKYFPIMLWTKIGAFFAYLFSSSYFSLGAVIIVGVCLTMIIILLVIRPYHNNIPSIINQFITFLCFLCYLIIQEVEVAEWTGFCVLILLYLQVFSNFILLAHSTYKTAKDNANSEDDDDDEDVEMEYYNPSQKRNNQYEDEQFPRTVPKQQIHYNAEMTGNGIRREMLQE